MRVSLHSCARPVVALALAAVVAGCGCSSSSEQQTTDPSQGVPKAEPSRGCLARLTTRPNAPLMAAALAAARARSAGAPLLYKKKASTDQTDKNAGGTDGASASADADANKDKGKGKGKSKATGAGASKIAGGGKAAAAAMVSVTFRVQVPANTPADASIYLAGDLQGWNPGDPSYRLTRQSAAVHAITLSLEDGAVIRFKFTRGSWETVEKGAQGQELSDRVLQVAGPETADVVVASWADTAPAPPRTIAGNIEEMSIPAFLGGRRVWVYLPPGYASQPDRCYPVLYMFDGQNVFDSSTAFLGNEWNVDQSLEDSIMAGAMQPIIVVAIDNGGGDRLSEYTPWPDPDYGGGQADAHFQAIVDSLIPYIDDNFRTYIDPAHTGVAGSSLGGLMSLYAAYARPDTFGVIGALSPSLWWNDQHLRRFIESAAKKPASTIYMDMGTIESGQVIDENGNGLDDNIDYLRVLRDVMTRQGFTLDKDLEVIEDEGARHNETAWARRIPGTLRFLFPPQGPPR